MYGWMEHRVCSYYRVYKNVEQYEWVDRGARAMQKVTGTTGGGLSLGTRCCLVMPYHDCDEEEDDSDDGDDFDDDIFIMMKCLFVCLCVTKNHHFPLPK